MRSIRFDGFPAASRRTQRKEQNSPGPTYVCPAGPITREAESIGRADYEIEMP